MEQDVNTLTITKSPSAVASEDVFPSIPGEFYGYRAEFMPHRPLYVFMKCKSNKDRTTAFAVTHEHECNLMFDFATGEVVSIQSAFAAGVLGNVSADALDETWVARTKMSVDEFHGLRARKERARLVEVTSAACSDRFTSTILTEGAIYAAVSKSGKHCLFFVERADKQMVAIEACHMLV